MATNAIAFSSRHHSEPQAQPDTGCSVVAARFSGGKSFICGTTSLGQLIMLGCFPLFRAIDMLWLKSAPDIVEHLSENPLPGGRAGASIASKYLSTAKVRR